MKARRQYGRGAGGAAVPAAFTLIELMVVIAVIGLLAGLLFTVGPGAMFNARKSAVKADLARLETAIEGYKTHRGTYPPDNPANPAMGPLFYELSGTMFDPRNNRYTTLNGDEAITPDTLRQVLGVSGLANSATDASENPPFRFSLAKSLYTEVKNPLDADVELLVVKYEGPDKTILGKDDRPINPWRYNSSNPTNNPNTYDLWVDLRLGSKKVRVCNWSREPLVIP